MIHPIAKFVGTAGLVMLCLISKVSAGMMPKDELEKLFEDQYIVGEIQSDLPVYPLFVKDAASPDSKPELKAYVFETNEVVSVRGYSGKPLNILVVIDLSGRLLSAKLIDHKEPIFVDSYGNAKLVEFAAQYKGLTVRHGIEIHKATDTPSRTEHSAYLRGVHRGTISAKAINRTIMSAAAKVAISKLKINVVDHFDEKHTDNESNTQNSNGDAKPVTTPVQPDPKLADASKPTTGSTIAEKVPSSDAATKDLPVSEPSDKPSSKVIDKEADSEQSKKSETTNDAAGQNLANEVTTASQSAAETSAQINYLSEDQDAWREWINLWQSRWQDIAILLSGLVILTLGLIAQKRFSESSRRLRILRTAYLLFTLGFVGWYAQGQLTIVNITAALESLSTGGDLSFLMNDPITVILWLFVGVTLLVWGRGTFCGWLCPFGALQELISLLANAIGIRQKRLRAALDEKLKWVKYGVLATLLASIYIAPSFAEKAVEIEPFKTAISFYFQRDWPYVLWAVACLLLGVVVYRGYCRYICPLGAALASVNFLQRWSWIPRREACGTPCQSCRHRCEYQAIAPTGEVNYSECFQCLDCVSIYQDDKRCLPLIQEKKVSRTVVSILPIHTAGVV